MTKVAPPERSSVYSIRTAQGVDPAADPSVYTPGEIVTLYISVEEKLIQRRIKKGERTCWCPPGYRVRGYDACGPKDVDGKTVQCNEPQMDSAKYIGFLLYAVDVNENKVGRWEVNDIPPVSFWLPNDVECGGISVMHADARPKNYVEAHTFRAPALDRDGHGVGPITFRALMKHGDTNEGSFYWPTAPAMSGSQGSPTAGTSGGDLVLTQARGTPPKQSWFTATKAGQSCDAVCADHGQACDLDGLVAASGSPAVLEQKVGAFYSTVTPAVAGCASALPAMSTANGERWLFFHANTAGANTCPADAITPPSCGAVPGKSDEGVFRMRRVCPCKAARRRLGGPSTVPEETARTIAKGVASRAGAAGCPHYTPPGAQRRRLESAGAAHVNAAAGRASVSLYALVGALALGGERAQPLLPLAALAVASVLLPCAEAHNWLWNPTSRASKASTTKPCRQRRSNIPDIHVNPGQNFNIEWSSGHGNGERGSGSSDSNAHYFTVVKVSFLLFTVTFYANHAHNLTRSP